MIPVFQPPEGHRYIIMQSLIKTKGMIVLQLLHSYDIIEPSPRGVLKKILAIFSYILFCGTFKIFYINIIFLLVTQRVTITFFMRVF